MAPADHFVNRGSGCGPRHARTSVTAVGPEASFQCDRVRRWGLSQWSHGRSTGLLSRFVPPPELKSAPFAPNRGAWTGDSGVGRPQGRPPRWGVGGRHIGDCSSTRWAPSRIRSVGAAARGIEWRARHGEDLAALIGGLAGGDQGARLQGRLDHQHAALARPETMRLRRGKVTGLGLTAPSGASVTTAPCAMISR